MKNNLKIKRLDELAIIVQNLKEVSSSLEKIAILERSSEFLNIFYPEDLILSLDKILDPLTDSQRVIEKKCKSSFKSRLSDLYHEAGIDDKLLIASIITIGEAPIVFRTVDSHLFDPVKFKKLLSVLKDVEAFYSQMGGIVGYHYAFLNLLQEIKNATVPLSDSESLLKPPGIDLTHTTLNLNEFIRWGIESLPGMAEIYPVGGAGDRLGLSDEVTGEALPAAALQFCGRSLLESLIRDLQAKEYLYYKLFGKQLLTPIAMMTSEEKNNHNHIKSICAQNRWFGRSEQGFFLFKQPLVPVITVEGHWSLSSPLELSLKPGGHGVIWKLAKDCGVFQWLSKKGRKKALIRQINNPVAGTDFGLICFCGIGYQNDKMFGFSSCPRVLNTAQGMVVLIAKHDKDHFEYNVSNIEYTDFSKKGLEDIPEFMGSPYSQFPANTNILFVDIEKIDELISKQPVPGLLINCKTYFPYIDEEGQLTELKAGRLESMMQNISDFIIESSDHPYSIKEHLDSKTYVTYSERRKTISVAKNSFHPHKSTLETPQGCFYEVLQNNHELFSKHCNITLPQLCDEQAYIKNGPNLCFGFHPALGPLYSVISQKIRNGRFLEGSELQLEICEVDIENLKLDGSLLIEASQPLGNLEDDAKIRYGEMSGKCELKNVRVKNRGINRLRENKYWKNEIDRHERLKIFLEGNSEFFAEDIAFVGNYTITVPDGFRYTAIKKGEKVAFRKQKIIAPTWHWKYSFQKDDRILLKKSIFE